MHIAITQRVQVVESYNERRDCLDQAWSSLLNKINCNLVPVPNTLVEPALWLDKLGIEALLLTGGNDLADIPNAVNPAPERDRTERLLLQWALERKVPVLGVCRGMQMLNAFFGGSLVPVTGHVASTHKVYSVESETLCHSYSSVNSYHNWGITTNDLADSLKPLVLAEDKTIEAFRHQSLPWVGIMWHPERDNALESENDIELLRKVFSNNLEQ